jgi:hypothetical protein
VVLIDLTVISFPAAPGIESTAAVTRDRVPSGSGVETVTGWRVCRVLIDGNKRAVMLGFTSS